MEYLSHHEGIQANLDHSAQDKLEGLMLNIDNFTFMRKYTNLRISPNRLRKTSM